MQKGKDYPDPRKDFDLGLHKNARRRIKRARKRSCKEKMKHYIMMIGGMI